MSQFVSLGMYAFTPQLKNAWQALYSTFLASWRGAGSLDRDCCWDHSAKRLQHPSLFFGYTCGYPLTHQLQNSVLPFCAAEFEIEGCRGIHYSSQFIVAADSDITSLEQCRGRRVGINNLDSNSGMNVLRHAIAPLADGKSFFQAVTNTGGHLSSMQSVAGGEIDLASIDAVSYQLAIDAYPELAERTRSIGLSVSTAGLPLVYATTNEVFDPQEILHRLNEALSGCDPRVRKILRIKQFLPVRLEDYNSIPDIEQQAIDLGYPTIS